MEAISRRISSVDWGQASRAIQKVSNDLNTPVTSSRSILDAGVAGVTMGASMGFGVGVAWGAFLFPRQAKW